MAKILIVEDSISQAAIISQLVKGLGHEPSYLKEYTRSVAQAVVSSEPEVVLLDLMLLGSDGKPIADGFHICREVKRLSKGKTRVVIVSAQEDDESTEWAFLQGADSFLRKPFTVKQLAQVLNQLLNPAEEKTER